MFKRLIVQLAEPICGHNIDQYLLSFKGNVLIIKCTECKTQLLLPPEAVDRHWTFELDNKPNLTIINGGKVVRIKTEEKPKDDGTGV